MKVTGWTYWNNTKYIDIGDENSKLRKKIMDSVPTKWPGFDVGATDEERERIVKQMQQHNKEVEAAFEKSEELQESNRLYEEIYDVVVKDIREHGYHFTGDDHQNCDYGVPVVDEKYILCMSMRSWGALIADAFPEEFEKDDKYDYVVWAWNTDFITGRTKIPDESLWV